MEVSFVKILCKPSQNNSSLNQLPPFSDEQLGSISQACIHRSYSSLPCPCLHSGALSLSSLNAALLSARITTASPPPPLLSAAPHRVLTSAIPRMVALHVRFLFLFLKSSAALFYHTQQLISRVDDNNNSRGTCDPSQIYCCGTYLSTVRDFWLSAVLV